MNNRNYIAALVLILVVLIGAFLFFYKREDTKNQNVSAYHDKIFVTSPMPNSQISSPVSISGYARGPWYFEAVFPIKIEDAAGKILGQGQGKAQSSWTTNDYVPFTAKITFTKSSTARGNIILEKDNPSGLPQNADQLAIPIKFQ